MQAAQPGQGLELMLYGMGVVVVFLIVLVYATRLLSALVLRFFPEPETVDAERPAAPAPATTVPVVPGAQDPALLAAVVAAVHAHRRRHLTS
jgi:oxaloacetate decarboxylase gamma subunit